MCLQLKKDSLKKKRVTFVDEDSSSPIKKTTEMSVAEENKIDEQNSPETISKSSSSSKKLSTIIIECDR